MSPDQNHWTDGASLPKPESEWTVEDWVDYYQGYHPSQAALRAAGLLRSLTDEEKAEIRSRVLDAYLKAEGY